LRRRRRTASADRRGRKGINGGIGSTRNSGSGVGGGGAFFCAGQRDVGMIINCCSLETIERAV